MEFTDFTELVKKEVEKRTGDGYSVRLDTVTKNNGVILNGITISQEGCNVSPAIYLNEYYAPYLDGTVTLGLITDIVMDLYNRNKPGKDIDMGYFRDYEAVKNGIVYKLINTEMNRALLEDIPHVPFHDLSIVFEYIVAQQDGESASILIRNAFLKMWGIDAEELYRTASTNTPLLRKYDIKNMNDVIRDITGAMANPCDIFPMYVLSNTNGTEGAACILYPDLLRDFAKACKSDLFIIPSSIHECLLLPYADPEEGRQIKEIIGEVNETQLCAEEVLSDSLYFYEQCTDELRML